MSKPKIDGGNGNGRDPKTGKFLPGNPGGPGGNANAQKAKQFRQALYDAVSVEDVHEITRALVKEAKAGNLYAAREIFDRLLGKAKVTMEVSERPVDVDPFEVMRDPEVVSALDRALARGATPN